MNGVENDVSLSRVDLKNMTDGVGAFLWILPFSNMDKIVAMRVLNQEMKRFKPTLDCITTKNIDFDHQF